MLAILRSLKTLRWAIPREACGVGNTKAKLEVGEVLGEQCQSQVGSWECLGA